MFKKDDLSADKSQSQAEKLDKPFFHRGKNKRDALLRYLKNKIKTATYEIKKKPLEQGSLQNGGNCTESCAFELWGKCSVILFPWCSLGSV